MNNKIIKFINTNIRPADTLHDWTLFILFILGCVAGIIVLTLRIINIWTVTI